MLSPSTNIFPAPETVPGEKTYLPGFGQPMNYYPDGKGKDRPFPSVLNPTDMNQSRTILELTTLREFKMLQIMNQITDKPNWNIKVFDEAVAEKWKSEALALTNEDITEAMMNWVIDELRYKASIFSQTGAVSVYTGDVVKSDSALPESFKHQLQAAVKALEDVPEKDKDWHPGSNGMVLDLVHPSLFPLVYGRSRVLERGRVTLEDCIARCGEGIEVPVPTEEESKVDPPPPHCDSLPYRILGETYSRKFQWLPCEVDISSDKAKITSYINNLHPEKHKALYGLIEQVIDATIPLWNTSLAPTVEVKWNRRTRIHYSASLDEGEEVERPEPGTFVAPTDPPQLDLREQFREKGLQVIVKLANIHLTPDNNHYAGGTWHVEGQLNEHICATALYYYSNENTANSTLAFRQQSDAVGVTYTNYAQDEHDFLEIVYGCRNGDPGVQIVGGVHTREGRLLTFPNILQHQVQPFGLKDASKPGHRKILALFLVDPHIRVLSTANVPPQQRDWWAGRLNEVGTGLDRLPQELKDEVFGEVQGGFPISLEEAKELRKELMEERKRIQVKHGYAFEYKQFSLCEH
ncbi:unnamed protein product [Cyclocybe aegerita]|uniref:Uncharacterized protein n=1 Tax=Cyclocybe aegerita TaxID=1973307 RepID=A0A8S0VQQ1_CYCAE|nr:unnamed protein product [Cyclocybe aegerita]